MKFLKIIRTISICFANLAITMGAANAMQLFEKFHSHPQLKNMGVVSPNIQRNFYSLNPPKFEKIPITKQKYVSAKSKLHLLQDILKKHPNLTINTQIPSTDTIWQLYEQDKYFIEKSIQNRSNKENIYKAIKRIHDKAIEAGWNSKMSISDYNLIGQFWVNLLSSSPESQIHALYDKQGKKNTFRGNFTSFSVSTVNLLDMNFQSYLKNIDTITKPWQRSHGFLMPHVSPTGSVPLSVMQESWGFFTQDGTNKACYVDFLAVPTNPVVNFDYLVDYPPCDAWTHDLWHVRDSRSGSHHDLNRAQILNLAQKTANMLSAIRQATLTPLDTQSINIAFFHAFHEADRPVTNLTHRIKVLISNQGTKLNFKILPSIYFDSLEQYKIYVGSTERMLGYKLEGDTFIDKYRSYLKISIKGLSLLKEFAHHYDDSFQL